MAGWQLLCSPEVSLGMIGTRMNRPIAIRAFSHGTSKRWQANSYGSYARLMPNDWFMVSSSIPVDVSQLGLLLHRRFKELWNRLLFCRSTAETHHLTSQVCHLLLPNHSTWSHSARCIQKIRHMVSNSCDILILCKLVELLTWVIDGYWWLLIVIDGYWLSIEGSCWANYLDFLWTSGCSSTTPNKFTNSFPSSMIWLLSALIVAQHLKAGAKDYPSGKLKLLLREIS